MKFAVVRLILISLSVILTVFVVIFALRWVGLQQQYAEVRHPLMKRPFVIIAEGGLPEEAPAYTAAAYDAAVDLHPEILLEADIYMTKDEKWVISPRLDLKGPNDPSGFVRNLNLDEIQKLDVASIYNETNKKPSTPTGHQLLSLQEWLDRYPDQGLVLDVQEKDPFVVDVLLDRLKDMETDKRLIIQSPFSSTLRQIKDEFPLFLYGMTPASLAQFGILEALYLEPFASLWADFVITPIELNGQRVLTPRLLAEIERRQKRLIVVHQDDFTSLSAPLLKVMDGVQTRQPDQALQFFKDRLLKEEVEP